MFTDYPFTDADEKNLDSLYLQVQALEKAVEDNKDSLIVEITGTGPNWVSEYTPAEILSAIKAGRNVLGCYESPTSGLIQFFWPFQGSESSFIFKNLTVRTDTSQNRATVYTLTVRADKTAHIVGNSTSD